MTDKHTEGPWLIATSNSWRRIVSQRGESVCEPIKQNDGHPDLYFRNGGADGPDARLLAAAPYLLEAQNLLELVAKERMTIAHEPSRGGWSVGAVVGGEFRWLAHDEVMRSAIVRAAAALALAGEVRSAR